MISQLIPVFLNGRSCRVAPGATLGQLLAQDDPALARALECGTAKATDGRGIPAAAGVLLVPGALFRVVRSARPDGAADA
jgi:hypothetical protein